MLRRRVWYAVVGGFQYQDGVEAECDFAIPKAFRVSSDGFRAGADTVGDADAVVAISRQRETGKLLTESFNSLQTFEMADGVLSHGALPFENPREQGLGGDVNDLFQFVPHDSENLVLG